MEQRFDHNFSHVRVHSGQRAAASADAVDARAYTVGRDIVFGAAQYVPQTRTGQNLLAHELTHVLQHDLKVGSDRGLEALEAEADGNAHRISAGLDAPAKNPAPRHLILRQGKKTTGGLKLDSGFEQKPEETTNRFSFTADAKIPLASGLKLGTVAFLENLKLETKGSQTSKEPINVAGTQLSSLQTKLALDVMRAEVPKLSTKIGTFGLGTTVDVSSSLTGTLGEKSALGGRLGAKGGFAGSFKLPTLRTGLGNFDLSANLGASGSLQQTVGEGGKFTPSFTTATGLKTAFESRPTGSGFVTLGGILGEEAKLSLRTSLGAATTAKPDSRPTGKLSGSGELGLTGKTAAGQEPFVKIRISGNINFDLSTGSFDANSRSFSLGVTTGFKF